MSEIIAKTDAHIFQTYGRFPIAFVRGEGAWLWDEEDKRYLDFLSGIAVCNLGHCHPAVVKAATEQMERLIHVSNFFYISTFCTNNNSRSRSMNNNSYSLWMSNNFDISNFFSLVIFPISWSEHSILKPQKTFDLQQVSAMSIFLTLHGAHNI